jgi:formate dehydrogenase major subunit
VAGLAAAFGSGAMTNSIEEIEGADAILAIGTNTTENHPVIGSRIKRAVRQQGAKLIVVDPRKIPLVKFADIWLRPKAGTNVAVLNGLMNVILSEGIQAKEYIETRTEGFDAFRETIEKYTPEYVEEISGVSADDLRNAARMYGEAEKAAILYTMGITQHTHGTDAVKSCANLAMLCGNVGIESGGVNPLRGQNNVQGACDMGALPNVFSGYQQVANEEARAKFEKAWGTTLPGNPGITIMEIMNGAHEGSIKGLYVMGENPMLSDPDITHVEEALKNLDIFVVQDIFLTETAALADVVLPSACFAEKDGTFSNTERRVQRIRKAVDAPGEAKADWQIIAELATKLGYSMNYSSAEDIMGEINDLTPSYAGITYERLEEEGLQWPCPSTDHPGTKYLHKDKFSRGLGLFSAIDYRPSDELPDEEYPFILTTGRVLYHYHTATMSRRSIGLNERYPEGLVEINPKDAEKLGINNGGMVKVSSRRGAVEVKATVIETPPEGTVFMTFHFKEAAANILTNPALDPIGQIPEYKVCAVKVEVFS